VGTQIKNVEFIQGVKCVEIEKKKLEWFIICVGETKGEKYRIKYILIKLK
jgi:hypothetical protein